MSLQQEVETQAHIEEECHEKMQGNIYKQRRQASEEINPWSWVFRF